jgi:serine/threonine-protein phosphatase PPG1
MEGFSSLFDNHLSTVWSAPNYCYRCGNSASILEVRPDGERYFNVFQAAPENERDGPTHQAQQSAGGKVRAAYLEFIVVSVPHIYVLPQLPEYFL